MVLIVTKTKTCISVYDRDALDGIDFFPNSKYGIKQISKLIVTMLSKKKDKK